MSNITVQEKNMQAVESALVKNDISQLTTQEKLTYYNRICESVGLNPLTKPFSFLKLQGKEVLYATKDCSEQLRKIHGVSTQIMSKVVVGDLFEVHVKARDKTGKEDEDIAYVVIKGLSGNDLANAMLKCVTKAKRRVTLSICGLGVLDESELDTVSNISLASNPQIESPFGLKNVNPEEQIDPIPDMAQEGQEVKNENDPGSYVAKFGKYKNQRVDEIPREHLKSYIYGYLENGSKEKGKPLDGDVLEFFNNGDAYLKAVADLTN